MWIIRKMMHFPSFQKNRNDIITFGGKFSVRLVYLRTPWAVLSENSKRRNPNFGFIVKRKYFQPIRTSFCESENQKSVSPISCRNCTQLLIWSCLPRFRFVFPRFRVFYNTLLMVRKTFKIAWKFAKYSK